MDRLNQEPLALPVPGRSSGFGALSPQERAKAARLFLIFFIIIAVFWVQKPLRTAKFITALGVQSLPLARIITALLILPVMFLYSATASSRRRQAVVTYCCALFAALTLAFRALLGPDAGGPAHFAYFFYVDLYVTVMVALFWSLANDVATPGEARRMYGFVGLGGILGGIAGSSITGWLLQRVDARALMLACAVMLAAVPFLSRPLGRMAPAARPPPAYLAGPWDAITAGARLTAASPYLRSIAAIVCLYEIVSGIVDYQFNAAAARAFQEEGALAAFLGRLGSVIIILSAVSQGLLTTWVLRARGPSVGILILPTLLGLGSLGFLAFPTFGVASAMFLADGMLHYSVNQTSKEILYTPADETVKYQAKAFIDMFVFRLAKAIGALAIAVSNAWLAPLGWTPRHLSLWSLLAISAWIPAALGAGARFRRLAPNKSA